jgi:hypothetical protein
MTEKTQPQATDKGRDSKERGIRYRWFCRAKAAEVVFEADKYALAAR